MELNHETAMRLWTKSFGRTTKVVDFAGREIYKGAYNDRNSEYGWNVDHIYPESRGGKTVDYNLICCNIKTNDEKADSFPIFNANGQRFQIKKSQNHYEIYPVQEKNSIQNNQLNLLDSADGIELIDRLDNMQNEEIYIGTVIIGLADVYNYSIIDFIEKIFENNSIYYKTKYIIIKNYNMPKPKYFWEMLDNCKMLNTYLNHYFLPLRYISKFFIMLRIECSSREKKVNSGDKDLNIICYDNTFSINELAKCNIRESDNVVQDMTRYSAFDNYYQYITEFKQLAKNLDKEVNGK